MSTSWMLTREEIAEFQRAAREHCSLRETALCTMASALLDIAELVPGKCDVVQRVRTIATTLLMPAGRTIAALGEVHDAYVEAELDLEELSLPAAVWKIKRERDALRTQLAALTNAAETYVFERDVRKLDAAVADARKLLGQ